MIFRNLKVTKKNIEKQALEYVEISYRNYVQIQNLLDLR